MLFIVLTITGFVISIIKATPRAVSSHPLGLSGLLIALILFLATSTIAEIHRELFGNSFFPLTLTPIVFNVFLIVSLLKKKTYYPWCQITVSSLNITNEVLMHFMRLHYFNHIETKMLIAVLFFKILPSAIIIAYLLNSKRVKNTFIY
ncbi:DUF2569 family protein [Candidatus Bodocaedibacter vickermanii]|uniref:DUF2569 family protein n=1 Tax=Candidatus Bodocaedibacter vickermanii TaxID=2741701 RepID=UPI00330764DE